MWNVDRIHSRSSFFSSSVKSAIISRISFSVILIHLVDFSRSLSATWWFNSACCLPSPAVVSQTDFAVEMLIQ
nr:MAG TPA: hypothetical protein [Caudoviricetes sp.]